MIGIEVPAKRYGMFGSTARAQLSIATAIDDVRKRVLRELLFGADPSEVSFNFDIYLQEALRSKYPDQRWRARFKKGSKTSYRYAQPILEDMYLYNGK